MSFICNFLLIDIFFWPLWSALVCGLFSNYLGSVNVSYFGPGLFYSLTSFLAIFVVKLKFFSTGHKDSILNYFLSKGFVLISCLNMISILMVAFTLWLVNNRIFCLFSSPLFFLTKPFYY